MSILSVPKVNKGGGGGRAGGRGGGGGGGKAGGRRGGGVGGGGKGGERGEVGGRGRREGRGEGRGVEVGGVQRSTKEEQTSTVLPNLTRLSVSLDSIAMIFILYI